MGWLIRRKKEDIQQLTDLSRPTNFEGCYIDPCIILTSLVSCKPSFLFRRIVDHYISLPSFSAAAWLFAVGCCLLTLYGQITYIAWHSCKLGRAKTM